MAVTSAMVIGSIAIYKGAEYVVTKIVDGIAYLMAKGGKQNIDNEYVREVQRKGIKDPCQYLRDLYKKSCDKQERRKIKQALKRFNCDGKDRYQ